MEPIKILTNDVIKILKKVIVAFYLIFIATQNPVFSQCPSAPDYPECCPGNELTTDDVNINSRDTFWFNDSGTFNNITINGGILVVYGNLTITTLNFNQGTIYVAPGATLTIHNILPSGGSLVNYGSVIFNGSVSWDGNPSMINASPTSSLTANEMMHLNNNSHLINNGTATISNFYIQTSNSPSVCQGNDAQLNLNQFINNTNNSIISPSGPSCLSVSNNALLNNVVTTDSTLIACVLSGANVSDSTNWGNATVINPCVSCSTALPIELISFKAACNKGSVYLEWVTASEINNDYFTLERSRDAINWTIVGTVDGAGNSNQNIIYSYVDNKPYNGVSYYRLKQTDFNGQFEYSNIISVICIDDFTGDINVYPNPFSDELIIEILGNTVPVNFEILNAEGSVIYQGNLIEKTRINTSSFAPGVYLINFENGKTFEFKKIIKE